MKVIYTEASNNEIAQILARLTDYEIRLLQDILDRRNRPEVLSESPLAAQLRIKDDIHTEFANDIGRSEILAELNDAYHRRIPAGVEI